MKLYLIYFGHVFFLTLQQHFFLYKQAQYKLTTTQN